MSDIKSWEEKNKETQKGCAAALIILIILSLILYKNCGSDENPVIKSEPVQSDATEEINNFSAAPEELHQGVTRTEEVPIDDLFEVYHYIYSKGNVIPAETNVLFVDGKNDSLNVTIDMPDGQTLFFYLADKTELGNINGMDAYLYKSQDNEKIQVFFHDGRKMMGFVSGKNNFVFMNTPNYNEN